MSDADPDIENDQDIRPRVAAPRGGHSVWLFASGVAIAAIMLFQALEARRTALSAPATAAQETADESASSPPDLVIPTDLAIPPEITPPATPLPFHQQSSHPRTATYRDMSPGSYTSPAGNAPPSPASYSLSGPLPPPPMVEDPSVAHAGVATALPANTAPSYVRDDQAGSKDERVEASRFANPATTVPKGTVIQAVLESALDSTRGGFARAIVSRDVYGFDGSHVLIQRGSRIIGEYKSDVSLGQRRLSIQWQRLMRPDGVMIDIDSPSADPLGRAGVSGSVNTHFFERFGGAILQTTLEIGGELASQAVSRGSVIVSVPTSIQTSTQPTAQLVQPDRIQPTVKVTEGTSVSVFVAKDLDFTAVGS